MEKKPFVDFKAVRERILLRTVFRRYGVQLHPTSGDSLKGNCPLPSHTSNTKGTFYANEEKNVWYCHSDSCKKNGSRGGNVIDFVAAMESLAPYDAAITLNEWYPATDVRQTAPSADGENSNGGNKPLGFKLKDVTPEHPMIQGRGISTETAADWGVGFFPGKGSMAGRIVFPLHENGVLVGYAGRATEEGQEPKWLMGKGVVKSFLYGLDRCDPGKPLVLVESFWAVLWLSQKGSHAAAIMGTELTEAQERALDPFGTVIVAMDNDEKGIEAAGRIAVRLRGKHRVIKARLLE